MKKSCALLGTRFLQIAERHLCPALSLAEGMILCTAANMFKIASPVIVYGVSASVVYGVIYYIIDLF